jgi:protein involved in sex pheromone biosynthesis
MLELTAEAEIYTRGVTIMKRTLAVLIICGLMLSGCGKTESDGTELQAGKTESASAERRA